MAYHVIVSSGGLFGPANDAWDVDEPRLRERIVEPYERGEPITLGGKTFTAEVPPQVEIYEGPTKDELVARDEPVLAVGMTALSGNSLREVTDAFIKGPFGFAAAASHPHCNGARTGAKTIFVVHGRNLDAAERVARRARDRTSLRLPRCDLHRSHRVRLGHSTRQAVA